MIYPPHLRLLVVRPALEIVEEYLEEIPSSPFVEDLLISTAAQETHCGQYLKQLQGPATSIYNYELPTFTDAINYAESVFRRKNVQNLLHFSGFSSVLDEGASPTNIPYLFNQSTTDLLLATVCARLIYFYSPVPFPPGIIPSDQSVHMENLWSIYKTIWNTREGAATQEEFNSNVSAYTDIPVPSTSHKE